MVIRGQKFYDMLDSDKQVKFGVHEVELVSIERVALDYLDENFEYVGTTYLYMVAVLLTGGRYVATLPHHDQDFIATIGHKLADMCKTHVASQN